LVVHISPPWLHLEVTAGMPDVVVPFNAIPRNGMAIEHVSGQYTNISHDGSSVIKTNDPLFVLVTCGVE
jgi:hypothetical protein